MNEIVSHNEWLEARKTLLAKEKQYKRLGDELVRQRRELPWEPVDKNYVFDTPLGKESLSNLFADRSQLAVYHFMFGPDWVEGCPACSFWADSFNGIDTHLAQRDVSFVVVSRGPLEKLEAFKQRTRWSFKWVSSGDNDFNRDYGVSIDPEVAAKGEAVYNYTFAAEKMPPEHAHATEHAGMSAFYRDTQGLLFHTYSCYARGLDDLNCTYQWLDRMPKGRDESDLPFTMDWLRHHDRYQ